MHAFEQNTKKKGEKKHGSACGHFCPGGGCRLNTGLLKHRHWTCPPPMSIATAEPMAKTINKKNKGGNRYRVSSKAHNTHAPCMTQDTSVCERPVPTRQLTNASTMSRLDGFFIQQYFESSTQIVSICI